MTQENLFQAVENQPPQLDPNKNYLTELVGENKKFKDPESLAKGKAEADAYVEYLKSQLDDMRKDYTQLREEHMAGARLQEMIDQMKRQQQSDPNGNNPPADDDVKQPEFKMDDVVKQVREELQKEQSQAKQQANFNMVQEKLNERFGNNFPNILKQQRESLGMSETQVNDLARQSPQAFFRLMGLDQPNQTENFQTPPSSTQRPSFTPNTQKRSWSWWQQLKKDKPKEYWSPKNITQRHKDAMELGEEFNDGDSATWDRLGNPTLRYG